MTREPTHASRAFTLDALLALVLAVGAVVFAALVPEGRHLDPLGAALLIGACAALPWRRVRPGLVLALVFAITVPYHILEYRHEAASPIALIALATYSSRVARVKALVTGLMVVAVAISIMSFARDGAVNGDHLGAIGWIFFAAVAGQAWRNHKAYIASLVDRAERAERTREAEARRRVAEERVRIARDLHDLLAHSITLIGVQAGVAAHLARQPRPDGAVLAQALETIADTCRDARAEVRAALTALREEDEAPQNGAVPGLAGLRDLAATVRNTGIEVEVTVDAGADEPAPAVGVAAYRIVQEALTNVVRHVGTGRVRVTAVREGDTLALTVADEGCGAEAAAAGGCAVPGQDTGEVSVPVSALVSAPVPGRPGDGPGGFGIIGMTERARSVGGTLTAGPGEDGGFVVRAVLPAGAGVNDGYAPGRSGSHDAVWRTDGSTFPNPVARGSVSPAQESAEAVRRDPGLVGSESPGSESPGPAPPGSDSPGTERPGQVAPARLAPAPEPWPAPHAHPSGPRPVPPPPPPPTPSPTPEAP